MSGLPAIRRPNQWRALALGYVAFVVLYLGAATFTPVTPRLLAPAAIDRAVPFLGWTVWVYFSQFVLLPLSIARARDDADRTQAFYSMVAATVIAAAIFAVWPTHIQRQVELPGGWTGLAWSALYLTDTPRNCFPSLHVALASLSGAALWRRGSRFAAVSWPALIAASTLTTRQHVFVDIAGGVVLAGLAWLLVSKLNHHERAQRTPDAARV